MRLSRASIAAANGLMGIAGSPALSRFAAGLWRVSAQQERYLQRLLEANASTVFGQRHQLGRIGSIGEFRAAVPLSDYEDYLPYIELIAAGVRDALTADPVRLFEPSSGSTSASKLVPYNRSLQREFRAAIGPWIASLNLFHPSVLPGRAYWSISPAGHSPRRHGCIPVGFDEDAQYLGGLSRVLLSHVTVGDPALARMTDMQEYRLLTLAYLLLAEDLSFVSVWSPTYLLGLLETLDRFPGAVMTRCARLVRGRSRNRLRLIERCLEQGPAALDFATLWPKLAVLSCWADGPSALYARQLTRRLSHPRLQPKGLLSTECFVSFPFLPHRDPVLAYTSHFFEFEDVETTQLVLAHEVEIGRQYAVVVTTGGGLYRYRTQDVVHITGRLGATPTMRFVAKQGLVSDRCGEKLSGAHVERAVTAALEACAVEANFAMLAPVEARAPGSGFYALFVALADGGQPPANSLCQCLEAALEENFHYAYCRKLSQLGRVRLFWVDETRKSAAQSYLERLSSLGRKLGDIKPASLSQLDGWEGWFAGRFAD